MRAGEIERARADVERLLVGADDVWAKAIGRRIAANHEPIPPLDDSRQALVAEEATSLEAEIRFGEKGPPAAVAAKCWITGETRILVGASDAVMGLIGATAAMMLRGWLNERAVAARNRGLAMAGVVLGQMAIDTLVPQLSFTAHLSGAAIGHAAALLLGDRLARPTPRPAARCLPPPSAACSEQGGCSRTWASRSSRWSFSLSAPRPKSPRHSRPSSANRSSGADIAVYARRAAMIDEVLVPFPIAGAAAAVAAAHLGKTAVGNLADRYAFDATARELRFSVREPFTSLSSTAEIVWGPITGSETLDLISQMPTGGVIFSDGMEQDFVKFEAGMRARLGIADRALELLWPGA